MVSLIIVGPLLFLLWISGIWDGSRWPLVEEKPPSLAEVEKRASTKFEGSVECGKTARADRYVCVDGAGLGWLIRADSRAEITVEDSTGPVSASDTLSEGPAQAGPLSLRRRITA